MNNYNPKAGKNLHWNATKNTKKNKMKKIKELYLRKYKRYSKYNLADRVLNYLDYITNRHGSKLVIIGLLWLCLLLCIEIFKTLI